MRDGFISVAAGTPKIRVADCRYNAEQIFTLMREADKQGVKVLALPELCLTGYTCGDLFLQDTLRLCEYVVSTYISTVFSGENIGVDDRRVVVQFMKCQLFGVWIDWVSGGMKEESLADLQRMIQLCRGVPELIVSHSSRQEP